MRIAMVAASWDSDEQRTHVAELCAVLSRHGHDVVLYLRRFALGLPERERTHHGYEIVRIPADEELRPMHLDRFFGFLRREWAVHPPSVAHLHGRVVGSAVIAHGVPIVQSFHNGGTSADARAVADRLRAGAVTQLVVTSQAEALALVRATVPRSRLAIVPGGVDVSLFRPDGPIANHGDRPRVLAMGDVAPHNGFHTAISALPWIPDADLMITGRIRHSDPRNDPEVLRLKAHAHTIGVADRVRFTGSVPTTKVPALLRSAALLISIPRQAPFGTAALRAMACGIPVVAAAVGALNDLIVDGVTGILLPSPEPRALGRALRELLATRTRREVYAVATSERVRARHSWDRIVLEVLAVYQAAIADTANGNNIQHASNEHTMVDNGAETSFFSQI